MSLIVPLKRPTAVRAAETMTEAMSQHLSSLQRLGSGSGPYRRDVRRVGLRVDVPSYGARREGETTDRLAAMPSGDRRLAKIEHVAIAVSDLDAAIEHYHQVWGAEVEHRETVVDQGVDEAMLPVGDSYLQLLGATSPDTTVG